MRVILIKEKRLEELVEASLNRLRARCTEPGDREEKLDYRAVHYEVHQLLNKLKEEE